MSNTLSEPITRTAARRPRRKLMRSAIAVMMAGALVACAENETLSRGIGATIGGVLGGVLGAQFGNGTGRAAAIALGAGLGALLGDEVARQMTERDREMAASNLEGALEDAPSNQVATWSNPESGNSGTAVAHEAYPQASRDCRDFETVVHTAEGEHMATGTACRNDDGSWQVVREPDAG